MRQWVRILMITVMLGFTVSCMHHKGRYGSELRDVQVVKVANQVQLIVPTSPIFFNHTSNLKPEATLMLRQIAKLIKAYDAAGIEVIGYTDVRGDALVNQAISAQQAQAIARYLYQHVDLSFIATAGRGAAKPLSSHLTAYGRKRNRRVEILFHSWRQTA